MNKVAFVTLGCKTNQYETDALMDLFYKNRYEVVDFDDFSDVYVINTCTVTSISDKKSRQMIRRAKKSNPNGIVVVVGCYAQISPDEVSAIEDVDIVVGTDARTSILNYISDYISGNTPKPYVIVEDISKIKIFEEMTVSNITTHTRAFVKIQEGCNQFCTYCIIPYARGRVRSRELAHVVDEIKQLTLKGYVEFVLTGIHIGSYGLDLEQVELIDLIESIHAIEGVKRIRLGSIEPRLISDSFVTRLSLLPKVCDHFHLSLQSGSNTVLKRMNRKYSAEEFYESVQRLKSVYKAPSLTTDIIVGFPGETNEEFLETMSFVEKVGFSEIHVFQFSRREGTPAAEMKDQIDGKIKKFRSEQLITKASQLTQIYQKQFINQELEVLVEEDKDGFSQGHSTNYLNVLIKDKVKSGTLLKVIVTEILENKLMATIEL